MMFDPSDYIAAFAAYWFVIVLFALPFYMLWGYVWMCIGRKARLDTDFMPFIPVARQIYQMRIAKCPVWYIFFVGPSFLTVAVPLLLSALLYMISDNLYGLIAALWVAYIIAMLVFNFLFYRQFYSKFGFSPNTAWLHILPLAPGIGVVFVCLIAFSNSIRYGKYVEPKDGGGLNGSKGGPVPQNKGVIVGVTGAYKDASFDLMDGGELSFGRDPQSVNIVFDQTQTDISRRHCQIRFDGRTNQYTITDLNSTTGTYLDNGTRLEAGQPKQVARGTVIYLGSSRKNSFRLN